MMPPRRNVSKWAEYVAREVSPQARRKITCSKKLLLNEALKRAARRSAVNQHPRTTSLIIAHPLLSE